MGYTTEFTGTFNLDKPLTEAQAAYLRKFSETRRMRRDAYVAAQLPDPAREAACLPIGPDGAYFVGGGGLAGQEKDASVIDFNAHGPFMPGLWCNWVPTEDRAGIEWSGMEKFYNYEEWLEFLISHFLVPWGYTLNGTVRFQGENDDDRGAVIVTNNVVRKAMDRIEVA